MRCPHCGGGSGGLSNAYGEIRCLLCGWYDVVPDAPPIAVNENRRWESVLCDRPSCPNSAIRGQHLCRPCREKARMKMGLDTDRERA